MSAPLGLRPRRNYRRIRWRKYALLGLVVLLFPAGYVTARLRPSPEPAYAEILVRDRIYQIGDTMLQESIMGPDEQSQAVALMFTQGIDTSGFDIVRQWGCPNRIIMLELKER